MSQKQQLRSLLEARCNEAGDQRVGRRQFVNEIRASLGLMKMTPATKGRPARFVESRDENKMPVLLENRLSPEHYSIKDIAEAIFDRKFGMYFDPQEGFDLLEAGPGLDPTSHLNINTFSLAVSGLVEAKIIEKFENPLHIGDQLVTVRPTKMNGEKMIGVTGIGDKAQQRKPGQPHARAGFDEHWIKTPELEEQALAVEVQQEMVFYDLTGQVLDTAASVGEELGYRREKDILRLFAGVDNPYSYKDTTYSTYQTAAPWINSQTNVAADYSDIDNAKTLLRRMRDPATNKEILVNATTLVHSPDVESLWDRILNSTEVRETTNTNTVTLSPNPARQNRYTLLWSEILNNVLQEASPNGLGLNATQASQRWWLGDPKKAFMWMEAWPLRTRQASANEYVMLDRGLIAAYFSNYRGVGAVREPRQNVENTH